MLRILKRWARAGSASVLTLARRTCGSNWAAAFSNTGANCLQGPHQGAQKSTTSGRSACTCLSKLLALSSTGRATNKAFLQCPHLPPSVRRSAGTRLLPWQWGQVITMGLVIVALRLGCSIDGGKITHLKYQSFLAGMVRQSIA